MKTLLGFISAMLCLVGTAFASGPYTAFTYGDPAAINLMPGASNPFISQVQNFLVFGLSIGGSSSPVPVGPVVGSGTIGTAYSLTFVAAGGTSPYTWVVTDPSNLPPGLSFSAGVLSGTPTTAGSYTFHVKVTDVNSLTGTQPFTLNVSAASVGGNYGLSGI